MKPANDDGPGAYVRRVAHDTQRYAEDLMIENHRLRLAVAALEGGEERAREIRRSADDILAHNDALLGRIATLERETQALQERLLEATAALEHHRREHDLLRASVQQVQAESDRRAAQHRDLEAQNSNLANLYVASYRLHSTLDRDEILGTIQEIVINLIGSEELAIFQLDDQTAMLRLLTSTGVDADEWRRIALGEGLVGHCAGTGRLFVSGHDPDPAPRSARDATLTACVPLKRSGRVWGVIAVFRLLPQKSRIEALDHELLDLLATHAGTALYCSALHASSGQAAV